MTEKEKMEAGLPYDFWDSELGEQKLRARDLCRKLNAAEPRDTEAQEAVIRELFGAVGDSPRVLPDFHCDCGKNITVGDNFLANYNVTILDRGPVRIGNNVVIAPGAVLSTVNHALEAAPRRAHICTAEPIVIGDDVWLGANCTVLPGVTIGNNVIVAAGAVVTKDVPDNTLVAGVPARPVRELGV